MNITIRRAEPGDYEALHQIFSGSRVIWGTAQLPYPSLEMWRKRLDAPPEGTFELVACVDGEVVGHLNIHTSPNRPRRRHAGRIDMAVRDDWQGKGVGTTLMQAALDLADNWLNLRRMELEVYTDNEPAVRLYTRASFVIEGTLRQYVYRDGQYVDVYAMARFRPERNEP
jgi:L-phenylalanine/L-methionine N-acetyltransferase